MVQLCDGIQKNFHRILTTKDIAHRRDDNTNTTNVVCEGIV